MISNEAHLVKIHHLGLVTGNLEESSELYQKLGYTPESEITHEKNQGVFVQFLVLGAYRIELIQPENESSPVYKFLKKGGGLHHICYESNNIEATIKYLRDEYRAICISLKESYSMIECKVAFFAKPDGEVLEIIQLINGTNYYLPVKKK